MADVHTLSGAYALDALGPEEAAEFRKHLEGCPACRQEVKELRAAAARMAAVESIEPPPELRARVLAAVDRTPQEPPVPRSEEAAAVVTPLGRPDRSNTRSTTRRLSGVRQRLTLAAAAVLLVGGGAIGVSQVLDDDPRESGLTAAQQVFRAEDAREVAASTANGGELLVAVSPSQQRMAVDTSQLPDLEGDRVYQIWTIDADDSVASVGIVEAPGESAAMALPEPGVRVALTIEPEGGSEAPTEAPIVAVEPAAV